MDVRFQELAELDAPSRYLSVEELADEASENMTLAVECYHSFFEADEYSQEYADTAYEYYSRAMKRVRYIGYLLAGGEIPEDENVTIYEEENDSNILQKWLSDDDEDTESENTSETEATETETSETASETNTEAAN